MSWFQIGSGYYGLAVQSVKVSDDTREVAAKAFESAFSIPSKDIRVNEKASDQPTPHTDPQKS